MLAPDEAATRATRWWRTYVSDVADEADDAALQHLAEVGPAASLRRAIIVLLAATVSLTLINFLRNGGSIAWLTAPLSFVGFDAAADRLTAGVTDTGNVAFNRLLWWAAISVAGYTVIPIAAIKAMRGRLVDFGAGPPPSLRSWTPYVLLFAVSVPFIALASNLPAFQERYPFYDVAPAEAWWPYLWIWWLVYALQFAALEFFFRGFMVFGLRLRLGIVAVFVMVVPYTMIHFTKPFPEALAAIVGGTVLGFLALKTRSVWPGAALHIAIAMTMDLFSLGRQGLL